MKKLRIDFLFAAALMLGGGLAVANNAATLDPNVYNATPNSTTETWTPLPSGSSITCNADDEVNCKGFDDGNGNITVLETGRAQ